MSELNHENKSAQEPEPIYMMEAGNGMTVSVPASKLEQWQYYQDHPEENPMLEHEDEIVKGILDEIYGPDDSDDPEPESDPEPCDSVRPHAVIMPAINQKAAEKASVPASIGIALISFLAYCVTHLVSMIVCLCVYGAIHSNWLTDALAAPIDRIIFPFEDRFLLIISLMMTTAFIRWLVSKIGRNAASQKLASRILSVSIIVIHAVSLVINLFSGNPIVPNIISIVFAFGL